MNSIYIENGADVDIQELRMSGNFLALTQDASLYSIHSHQFEYGGGFHLKNMKKISTFKAIKMEFLTSENGGGIFVQLDHNYRAMGYNSEQYQFEDIQILNCTSFENGGGFYIDSIRSMSISGNTVVRYNGAAH
mmetsp:Transcript_25292/g.39099  ORF Transcript_25292/g.39099 Transcript_25292/m.39099 type:complete len:134 (+) Transcript_25292:2186-2587(+)